MKHADMPATEDQLTERGLCHLDSTHLAAAVGRIGPMFGLYRAPFSFEGRFNPDGTVVGRNNFGTSDSGRWHIDGDTLCLNWAGGWDNTVTRAYEDEGILHFFDVGSGQWRMSVTAVAAH